MAKPGRDSESPFSMPRNTVSQEQADQMAKQGGQGGSGSDFPTFMRKEQQNPEKLPKSTPSKPGSN